MSYKHCLKQQQYNLARKVKYFILAVTLCFCHFNSLGQQDSKIDSLLILLKNNKADTNKVNHLNNVGNEYRKIGSYDSTIKYCNDALQLAQQLNFKKGIAGSYTNIGIVYHQKGDYPQALDYYQRALSINLERNDKNGFAAVLSNIGNVYRYQADYPKALDYYLKALKIEEELGNKNGIARLLGNIGIVYAVQKDYAKTLEYFFKALKMAEEIGAKNSIAIQLGNIGNVYYNQTDYLKAREFFLKALELELELGNKNHIAAWLGNIGNVYSDEADKIITGISSVRRDSLKQIALEYYFKALKMKEELGDKSEIAITLGNIGTVYTEIKKYAEAEKYLLAALKLDKEIGALNEEMTFEESLSDLYTQTNRHKLALEHYKKAMVLKDSLFNEEKNQDITRKEMNYEFEKKEALANAEQDKKDAITTEEKRRQKILIYSISGSLFLVLLLALFIFRGYRQKQKANIIITEQKHIVDEKNKEILDSINYAKRIQNAILPSQKIVKEYLPSSFILYKPKDIVAGDFYWMEHKDGKVLFAAADCTGHGVPGAMVSVVCNNGLNRSVREHGFTDPGKILDKTREIVVQEFEKSEEEVKDGMDIALCSLKENTLQYAGANNPLWIIRKGEVLETKANKQPIGKFDNPLPYTTHTIELQQGDTFYIFSDGYADQFGGKSQKKFKTKAFKELLVNIQTKTLDQQRLLIDNTFEEWKGKLEQVDDVCIIGVRI